MCINTAHLTLSSLCIQGPRAQYGLPGDYNGGERSQKDHDSYQSAGARVSCGPFVRIHRLLPGERNVIECRADMEKCQGKKRNAQRHMYRVPQREHSPDECQTGDLITELPAPDQQIT